MKKKIIAILLLFTSINFNAYAGEIINSNNIINVVSYSNIKTNILDRNITVKVNKNLVESIKTNYANFSEVEDDLEVSIGKMKDLVWMYQQQMKSFSAGSASGNEGEESSELSNISRMVQGIFSSNIIALQGNISSMENQLENIIKQQEDMQTTIEKMNVNAEMVNSQMTGIAENLIFAYNAISKQEKTIGNNISNLKDKIRALKIQENLGYVSSEDVENVKFLIEELSFTKNSLNSQKINIIRQLNLLLGQDCDIQLEILFTDILDMSKINSMNNKIDLYNALGSSYELKLKRYEVVAKQVALSRVKNDKDENLNEYKVAEIDLENVNLQFEDAKRNYELKFQQTYEAVKDKQKVMALEEKKLAQEKTKLEAANKKYDLGMISKVEYDNVKSSYDLQGIKVETAKGDLFTVYRKYEWMLKGLSV